MPNDFILPVDFNPGAYPDRPDERDHQYEDRFVLGAPTIDWDKGYDVELELNITLKREAQDGSLSCVAQAYTKYGEVLNFVETGELVDLSAKSIYEQIYLPTGGAYLRDGAKVIVKGGIALESDVGSYEALQAPSETFMRQQTLTAEIRRKMLVFQAKEYALIGSASPEYIAAAILNNHGCVTGATGSNAGWAQSVIRPPLSGEPTWGHAIYLLAFGMDATGKWFEFLNSWGPNWGKNGRGRVYFNQYDMANNFFGNWTLVDLPNQGETMIETIKFTDDSKIYAKDATSNKLDWIGGWSTYTEGLARGWFKTYVELTPDQRSQYSITGEIFGFIK